MTRISWIPSLFVVALIALFARGCGNSHSPGGGALAPSEAEGGEDATPPIPALAPLPASRKVEWSTLATSHVCATCHTNEATASAMRDEDNRAISPHELWQATMMANASRDPVWRAFVSAEIAATPTRAAEIQTKCMQCHAPMLAKHHAPAGPALTDLYGDTDAAQLGLDGVSCATCHKITADNLGEAASFSGHFTLAADRVVFGPYAELNPNPMWRFSGFEPRYGAHVEASSLCATCHTLFTQTVDDKGSAKGHTLPEQTPYLEWRNSDFNNEIETVGPDAASCQACHMPSSSVDGVPIVTQAARRPPGGDYGRGAARTRDAYHRHLFVGGNTWVPALLRDHAAALQPKAPASAFEEVIRRARSQLANDTASVAIEKTRRTASGVSFEVLVTNKAGHKLPTGIPIRRAWLRVRVMDENDNVVFESGAFDTAGRLLDGRGAVLAAERRNGPIHPHRDRISSADHVQVYESVMADAQGATTHLLMRAASYVKDNRLLPRGWRDDHPDIADIAPRGGAAKDTTFVGGSDRVSYEVALPTGGSHRIEVALLYVPIGARFVDELRAYRTPEVTALLRMLEETTLAPETLAAATMPIP